MDRALARLVEAIVAGNQATFRQMLDQDPTLALAKFESGATRSSPEVGQRFVESTGIYIYQGDTALHFAAAAYRSEMAKALVKLGAMARAKNRRGNEPLHSAAMGSPDGTAWNPANQVRTIFELVAAGADCNAQNLDGATPLHKAIRSRCADAVEALLQSGADRAIRNKNGSTPVDLIANATGRSGAGSAEARAQLEKIRSIFSRR